MNSSSISRNKLLISPNLQQQIRIPMNPRTNNIKSPKSTRVYVNLDLSYLATLKNNSDSTRNLPKTETLAQEQPISFKYGNLQKNEAQIMLI